MLSSRIACKKNQLGRRRRVSGGEGKSLKGLSLKIKHVLIYGRPPESIEALKFIKIRNFVLKAFKFSHLPVISQGGNSVLKNPIFYHRSMFMLFERLTTR